MEKMNEKRATISTKYTDLARMKNKELDTIKEDLENYREEITKIFNDIAIEFPNDKSFFLGVETIVNQILTSIANCEETIDNMKNSSLREAKRKDENLTAQLQKNISERG